MAVKKCSQGHPNGVRARQCKICLESFGYFPRKKKPSGEKVNWKELKTGDRIRIIAGSGPYVLIDGVKQSVGHSGIVKVKKLDEKGIHAYDSGGFVYLYMSETVDSSIGVRQPYKIRKIK